MKKILFALSCILFWTTTNCFSQSPPSNSLETNTGYLHGYIDEFEKGCSLGLTFGKINHSTDSAYYVKFQLYTSALEEYVFSIHISLADTISFLTKDGQKIVSLRVADVSPYAKEESMESYSKWTEVSSDEYSMTMMLEITKEQLDAIASNRFSKIIVPFINSSTKVVGSIKFRKPALSGGKRVVQKQAKQVVGM